MSICHISQKINFDFDKHEEKPTLGSNFPYLNQTSEWGSKKGRDLEMSELDSFLWEFSTSFNKNLKRDFSERFLCQNPNFLDWPTIIQGEKIYFKSLLMITKINKELRIKTKMRRSLEILIDLIGYWTSPEGGPDKSDNPYWNPMRGAGQIWFAKPILAG
jgi:hypothetical protein